MIDRRRELSMLVRWLLGACLASAAFAKKGLLGAAFGRKQGVAVVLTDAGRDQEEQARIRRRCAPGSSSPTYGPWLMAAYWDPSSRDVVLSVSEEFNVEEPRTAQWTYALGQQAPSRVVKTGDHGGGEGARFVHFHAPDAALDGLYDVRNVTVSVSKARGGAPVLTELLLCHRDVFTGNSKHHYLAGHTIIKTSHVNDVTGNGDYSHDVGMVEANICRFIEWVSHHVGLGVGHMFVHTHHDDAVTAVPAVQQLVRDGVLTLIPWNFDAYFERAEFGEKVGKLDPFLNVQEMALQDANHRFSARFDWIIMCDTDEFFTPKKALREAGGLVALLRKYGTDAHARSTCALQVPSRFVGSSGPSQFKSLSSRSLANGCLPLMTKTFTTACSDFVPNGREKVIVRSRAKISEQLLKPTEMLSVALHTVERPATCMVKVDPVNVMEVLHYRERGRGKGPYCNDRVTMLSKANIRREICAYSAVLQGDVPLFSVSGSRRHVLPKLAERLSGQEMAVSAVKEKLCLTYSGIMQGGTKQIAAVRPGDTALTLKRPWPWRTGVAGFPVASAVAATIRALLRPVSPAPPFSARYLATKKGVEALAAMRAQQEASLTPAQQHARKLQRQTRFDQCLVLYVKNPTAEVGVTWGKMRKAQQIEWGNLKCDEFKRLLRKKRGLRGPLASVRRGREQVRV